MMNACTSRTVTSLPARRRICRRRRRWY